MDIDNDTPERVVPYGAKTHPMYKQWVKMLDSCDDPKHPLYPIVGAKGITVMHRWYNFENFVLDNQKLFDDEPSRPATLRRAYISRLNFRAGFNPKNLVWVTKREAVAIQPGTICVDTIHGKNMPLKALAEYLKKHEGEPLPDGAKLYMHWHRRWHAGSMRTERVLEPLRTIQAIKLHELRRRYKAGEDLLAPVREYATANRIEDERESALIAELDRNRKQNLVPDDAPYFAKNRGFL